MGYTIFGINGIAPTLISSTNRHYQRYQIDNKRYDTKSAIAKSAIRSHGAKRSKLSNGAQRKLSNGAQRNNKYRRLTNIEYARIQGFPDNYCNGISIKQWQKK